MLQQATMTAGNLSRDMPGRPSVIVRPYLLLPWQREIRRWTYRYIVIAAGRRSGKTYLACDRLVNDAMEFPGLPEWYVAPTYGMAKDIAWPLLKFMLRPFVEVGAVRKFYESDLKIDFANGATIALKGSENEDSLRGRGLGGVVVDEIGVMDGKSVWEEVLFPALSDHGGRAIFIGTPKGYNYFYDLFQNELKHPGLWKSKLMKTADAGTIPAAEIDEARRNLDARAFRQEYEASFETFGGRVYPDFDREKHVAKAPIAFNPGLEYGVGLDFGWSATMPALFFNVAPDETVYVFDELGRRETAILDMGRLIADQVSGHRPSMIGCDPAGDSTTEALGRSSVSELRSIFGHSIVQYRRHYPGSVADGINQVRKWIKNGKLIVSPKCIKLIQALEMYRYPDPKDDVKSEKPLKDGISDHWADALRYFFSVRFPYKKATVGAY